MSVPDLQFVDETVSRLGRRPDAVIPILQALQEHYQYLPREALERVCALTDITPATIAGVSTFYTYFRHEPRGKHLVRVCRGTACHVRGADLVRDALHHHLHMPPGKDTTGDGQYTVETVACLGCCTLAPVVQMDQATYGHLVPGTVPQMLLDFREAHAGGNGALPAGTGRWLDPQRLEGEIRIGLGSCCIAKGSQKLFDAFGAALAQTHAAAVVKRVGCVGMCHQTPLVEVCIQGRPSAFYAQVRPDDAHAIVRAHFQPHGVLPRVNYALTGALDRWLTGEQPAPVEERSLDMNGCDACAFLSRQKRIATEHFGVLDPLDLDQYLAHDGFAALRKALAEHSPQQLIEEILRSGLRGRGGAGFPTGQKWARVRAATSSDGVKYVICNGDEGDPGAFMDRMLLESFPYRILEGMAVAAYAVGAHEGYLYIRAEYPLAVQRVREAIKQCEARGLLGEHALGRGQPLKLIIKEGAGAFVCGEETALIASIEGGRGIPRLRPPFPAESGLWGRPTLVNNVETFSMVPWIVRHGGDTFAALGTGKSKGTKVFALAGKVRLAGLIEVPMGTTIRQIVEEIGGGCLDGRRFKAVQVGGPSGGCIPADLADTPVDYEALTQLGAIMGSGGMVVLDDADCMVDIARYFLEFTQDQSCGQCTFCRIGTKRMLEILQRICAGKGRKNDLTELENLAGLTQQGSLCGLGKTAPNPVLTTLRYFRDEYEAHLRGRCPAGKCKALIKYWVTDQCTGCTLCAQQCPADAIAFRPFQKHEIDLVKCTRCDTCRNVCPDHAIEVGSEVTQRRSDVVTK